MMLWSFTVLFAPQGQAVLLVLNVVERLPEVDPHPLASEAGNLPEDELHVDDGNSVVSGETEEFLRCADDALAILVTRRHGGDFRVQVPPVHVDGDDGGFFGIERYHFLQLIRHLGAIKNLYLLCAHGFTPLHENRWTGSPLDVHSIVHIAGIENGGRGRAFRA